MRAPVWSQMLGRSHVGDEAFLMTRCIAQNGIHYEVLAKRRDLTMWWLDDGQLS